jgi:hypothetical protein
MKHITTSNERAMTRTTVTPYVLAMAVVALASGCSSSKKQPPAQPHRIAEIDHLSSPEALSFDPAQNVYFISNVNGTPGVKDGNGFISRVTADGVMDSLHFIQGGRDSATLDAPMGSRVQGDTLWVLDVDKLRGFNTHTGAPLTVVDFAPFSAHFLNDLAIDSTGEFYITDTGVQAEPDGKMTHPGPDRIFRVARDRTVTIALSTSFLSSPDGIDFDRRGRRFVLAPFAGNAVQQWKSSDPGPSDVAKGKGLFDGVEVEPNGAILITSWNDSSISTLEGPKLVPRISKLPYPPADVSMDVGRSRVGIVSLANDRFELWEWPSTK